MVDGETGLVYSPATVEGLARCLERAYESPDLLERLSTNAGELYRERLTLDRAVDRFVSVLRDCAGGSSTSR